MKRTDYEKECICFSCPCAGSLPARSGTRGRDCCRLCSRPHGLYRPD
ncbi:MAG: hypothetical protein IJT74_08480 [Bacteroidales bacterium]|nr:hypothetical protein [Bacteroidales bacterium]